MVRGNLRSKTSLDISGIARSLGGWGAGARLHDEGDIDQVLSKALLPLVALVEGDGEGSDAR